MLEKEEEEKEKEKEREKGKTTEDIIKDLKGQLKYVGVSCALSTAVRNH